MLVSATQSRRIGYLTQHKAQCDIPRDVLHSVSNIKISNVLFLSTFWVFDYLFSLGGPLCVQTPNTDRETKLFLKFNTAQGFVSFKLTDDTSIFVENDRVFSLQRVKNVSDMQQGFFCFLTEER